MTAPDIETIENSGRRWNGEDHRVVRVRWEPYKPDGQRQMKAKGRWQEQAVSGDYWRWQNCDRPAGLSAAPDPAAIREAALREAADICDGEERQGGTGWECRDAILALIEKEPKE